MGRFQIGQLALESETALPDVEDLTLTEIQVYKADKVINGINNALESINTLVTIQDKLSTQKLKATDLAIVRITTESISKAMDMRPTAIALEDHKDPQIALENVVTDLISKVWEAIKNAFKWLWDFLMGSDKQSNAKQIDSSLSKVKKESKANKDKESKYVVRGVVSTNQVEALTKGLAFYNKNLTGKDLIQHIDKLYNNISILSKQTDILFKVNSDISDSIMKTNMEHRNAIDIHQVDLSLSDMVKFFQDNYSKDNRNKALSVISNSTDMSKVIFDSVRTLDGFVNGGAAYVYKQKNEPIDTSFYIKVSSFVTSPSESATLSTMSLKDADHLFNKIEDVSKLYMKFTNELAKATKAIKSDQERLVNKLNSTVARVKTSSYEIKDNLNKMRGIVNFLIPLMEKHQQIVNMSENTLKHSVKLIHVVYKNCIHEG